MKKIKTMVKKLWENEESLFRNKMAIKWGYNAFNYWFNFVYYGWVNSFWNNLEFVTVSQYSWYFPVCRMEKKKLFNLAWAIESLVLTSFSPLRFWKFHWELRNSVLKILGFPFDVRVGSISWRRGHYLLVMVLGILV